MKMRFNRIFDVFIFKGKIPKDLVKIINKSDIELYGVKQIYETEEGFKCARFVLNNYGSRFILRDMWKDDVFDLRLGDYIIWDGKTRKLTVTKDINDYTEVL